MTLRKISLVASALGAACSLTLLYRASPSRPSALIALFVIWILAPYAGLLALSRWYAAVASWMMVVLPAASVAIYVADAIAPRQAQAAFVYVAVPLASWVAIAAVTAIAAMRSRQP